MNDSSTGGFLQQSDTLPFNDSLLDDVLQQLITGVTGLPGTLVRPRWQRPDTDPNTPPTQPAPNIDWCSVGVVHQTPFDYPYEYHVSAGTGNSVQVSWEELDVLASFFGPNCRGNASTLRAGLYLSQNREGLLSTLIKLTNVGIATIVPDIVNVQWISRCDLPMAFTREIRRTYPIRNIKSVQGGISADIDPLLTNKILVTPPKGTTI